MAGTVSVKVGKFLSIINCDVADFAGVTIFSNNLALPWAGVVNSPDSLTGLGVMGTIWRARRVGAGMGAMFTPIVSTKWRLGAMKEPGVIHCGGIGPAQVALDFIFRIVIRMAGIK